MVQGGKEEARGGRTVLVVHDEDDIREVFESVLRYDGYEVLSSFK